MPEGAQPGVHVTGLDLFLIRTCSFVVPPDAFPSQGDVIELEVGVDTSQEEAPSDMSDMEVGADKRKQGSLAAHMDQMASKRPRLQE